jgi:fructose-1,6-bisphosphatase/sedoheptulose 1,7-bisphosphatase-like protein
VRCGARQRRELERLCRTITRPATAVERLKRTGAGDVVLQLKSAYRDSTTHIVMSSGLACTRVATLTGAAAGAVPGGLIRKVTTVLQRGRRSGSDRARAKRSNCLNVRRLGAMKGSNGHRERGIFTEHRAIDRFSGRRYSYG